MLNTIAAVRLVTGVVHVALDPPSWGGGPGLGELLVAALCLALAAVRLVTGVVQAALACRC